MCTFFMGDFMKNDEYYMTLALKEAKKAYFKGEIPIGAVVVKNAKVISKGHNLKESKNNVIKHAEIVAIEKACAKLKNWRLLDCIIYVTMFPCPMCASAINQARFSRVVCGTTPEYAEKDIVYKILKDKNYGLPVEIAENIMEYSCAKLLKDFFIEKRQ